MLSYQKQLEKTIDNQFRKLKPEKVQDNFEIPNEYLSEIDQINQESISDINLKQASMDLLSKDDQSKESRLNVFNTWKLCIWKFTFFKKMKIKFIFLIFFKFVIF